MDGEEDKHFRREGASTFLWSIHDACVRMLRCFLADATAALCRECWGAVFSPPGVLLVVLRAAVLSRIQDMFRRLRTHCIFRVACRPKCRRTRRLVKFLGSITDYSSGLSYQVDRARGPILRFALLGSSIRANVGFHNVPNKRRFASLLLTILGTSKGKGGLPSRTVHHHVQTLRNGVDLRACMSLAYAGYPSIIRTLGVVTLLGPRIARRVISKTLGRRRISTLGVRTIPSICTGNGLLRMNHNSLKRLLRGLRRTFNDTPRRSRIPVRESFSILMLNNKPTKTSTTVCSMHGKLQITVITRHVNKRIGRAMNVRGLVSIPRAAKARLTGTLHARVRRCPVRVFRRQGVRGMRLRKARGDISAMNNRMFRTPTMVVTAKTD